MQSFYTIANENPDQNSKVRYLHFKVLKLSFKTFYGRIFSQKYSEITLTASI